MQYDYIQQKLSVDLNDKFLFKKQIFKSLEINI